MDRATRFYRAGPGFESSWGYVSSDEHRLTGRPYLGVTLYGPRWYPDHDNKFFWSETSDEDGWTYQKPRWTLAPFRMVYNVQHKLQPLLCRVGNHRRCDIMEVDGSVVDGECFDCVKLVKPVKPRPADAERARQWREANEMGDRIRERLETEEWLDFAWNEWPDD